MVRESPLEPQASLLGESARLQESLGKLMRVLQHHDRIRASRYDLPVSQCHALQTFLRWGPMTVTELGEHLYLEKSTASRLAKALLKRDLVRRRAPRDDGRVVILQLTEGGQRAARRIVQDLTEDYQLLLRSFDPEVRPTIHHLLDRLSHLILAEARLLK